MSSSAQSPEFGDVEPADLTQHRQFGIRGPIVPRQLAIDLLQLEQPQAAGPEQEQIEIGRQIGFLDGLDVEVEIGQHCPAINPF
jgi:hypothetical protein